MSIIFANITKARARLQTIVDGLRLAAGGVVVERAAVKVQAQIDAVSKAKLDVHEESGASLASAQTAHYGGLVQLTTTDYLRFHGWWPFRRGMPPFVVTRAARIFAAELLAVIGSSASGPALAAANEVVEEDAAADAKRAERKVYQARQRKLESKKKRNKKLREKLAKARGAT